MPGNPHNLLRPSEIDEVKGYLVSNVHKDLKIRPSQVLDHQNEILNYLKKVYAASNLQLDEALRDKIFVEILDELISLGSFLALLENPRVSEVLINSYNRVSIIRNGKIEKASIRFEDKNKVLRLAELLFLQAGKTLDQSEPIMEARLPDGARLMVIFPPVAVDGPSIILKKQTQHTQSFENLIKSNVLTESVVQFLQACVSSGLNIIVSGAKDSGKTVLLGLLANFIPENERIIICEDLAEISLQHQHMLRMETKPVGASGRSVVTLKDLVYSALRMFPDRLIVGELHGPEVNLVLKSLSAGYEGFLATVNAHNPSDALKHLEAMCYLDEPELTLFAVREQIATAIDLVVHITCFRSGQFKVISVSEVSGMAGDNVVLSEIFKFEQTGTNEQGMVEGSLNPTGIRPLFSSRLESAGFMFGPEIYGSSIGDVFSRKR